MLILINFDMSNLTYTAEGKYDSIGNTTVNVYIPSEAASDSYKTLIYNLSKHIV